MLSQKIKAAVLLMLAGAAPWAAAQTTDPSVVCQAQLTTMSASLNSVCCEPASNCNDGFPVECNAACANLWNPFANTCKSFIEATLPALAGLDTKCAATGGGSGSFDVKAAPTMYYVQVTVDINAGKAANPGKKQNRFKGEFAADVAEALGINEKAVFITSISASSIAFDIFAMSQSDAQSLASKLTSQLADSDSDIMNGFVTDSITNGAGAQIQQMHTGGSGGGASSSPPGTPTPGASLPLALPPRATLFHRH